MSKIVIVSCIFPPEPLVSGRLSDDLAHELSKEKEVVVLCPPPSRPIGSRHHRKNQEEPFKVITLPSYICPESRIFGRMKESYSFGKYVAKYISEHREEIECIYANTHPTYGQYLLLKEAEKHNIPCIIHIQDVYPESLTVKLGAFGKIVEGILVGYDRRKMKKAARLIAISESMRKYLIKSRRYDPNKIDVVYNWQDDTIFHQYAPKENEKLTFMFAGSLSPTAGLPEVIRAFGKAGMKNAKLILAGDGTDKEECVRTAEAYPEADIEFMMVSPETVPEVQHKADVLLLPLKKGISKTAFPSKLPAYLFSGKPIIACCEDDSDISEVIKAANCGWIVAPEDSEALAAQFKAVSEYDYATLGEMGERGRKYGFGKLSRKTNLDKLVSVILGCQNRSAE